MANGINDFKGTQALFNNDVVNTRRIIESYRFIDFGSITAVRSDGRIDCELEGAFYTNVEVLVLGTDYLGVKIEPQVGDKVLILTPKTSVPQVEKFSPDYTMPFYDVAGTKAIPVSTGNAKQLLTVTKDSIEMTGDNKFTWNSEGIVLEDVNGNKVTTSSNGVEVKGQKGTLVIS